jgi:diacylglycerol O-acyltransferase
MQPSQEVVMDRSFPSRLSPSDSLMWRIERDPVLRSPVLAIGLLDRDPAWPAVQRTFARAVKRVPRLTQRLEQTPSGVLRWIDDDAFSLDFHVRRVAAPHPGDIRSVLDIATPLATSALDPARPLWECTIVHGLEGGRAAFILKFHHTMADGVGGLELAEDVFDHRRSGDALRTQIEEHAASTPMPKVHPLAVVGRYVAAGLSSARSPRSTLRGMTRLARSTARMLAPVPEPLSPLFTDRSLDRHLDVIELPVAQLRAAADDIGVTVNAVFLGAIGGALHDFHQRLGSSVPAIRVTMPVNVRSEDDAPGGNRFVPVRFVLPIDDPDPRDRALLAAAICRRERGEPAMKLTDVLATLLDRLPAPLVTRLFASMLKNVDLDAVDLRGLQRPLHLGGARIDRLWAFAPPTGAALSITLLSHLDTACVSIVTDTAAVSDPALLTTCVEDGFAQMSALAERRAS